MIQSQSILVALFIAAASLSADGRAARPNILFAIGDNWAYPHASTLGDPTVKTPVFDRIVAEGILFANAFCTVPSCSPARSSLLTGRYPHELGEAASLWSNFETFPVFTDMLAASGYEVGHTGKGWSPGRAGENGWDHDPAGKEYDSFAEFMEQRDPEKPFFFWYGNTSVALGRWRYGPEHWGDMNPDTVRIPPNLPDAVEVRETILAYYSAVQQQDRIFGEAVQRVENAGLLDDTLVIYTGDNGWQMPRGLANCYDGGVRIPLAMRWGDRLEAGRMVDGFVSLTDFAPTFLELTGLDVPKEMTGRSFAGAMIGEDNLPRGTTCFLNASGTRTSDRTTAATRCGLSEPATFCTSGICVPIAGRPVIQMPGCPWESLAMSTVRGPKISSSKTATLPRFDRSSR